MGLRRLLKAVRAGVMAQFANCSYERSCEPGIELDFVHAVRILAVALQDAEIVCKLENPEIHFEVNSHAFFLVT